MQLLRIPVLIAILLASGPLQERYTRQRFVFTLDGAIAAIPSWLALVAVAVAFILAAGYGRDRRHSTPVLVLEGLLAVVITIVPPLIWARVAGVGAWTSAMGGSSGTSFAQILAVVWLMLVVRTWRQRAAKG